MIQSLVIISTIWLLLETAIHKKLDIHCDLFESVITKTFSKHLFTICTSNGKATSWARPNQ